MTSMVYETAPVSHTLSCKPTQCETAPVNLNNKKHNVTLLQLNNPMEMSPHNAHAHSPECIL